jgi:hypothetical protein
MAFDAVLGNEWFDLSLQDLLSIGPQSGLARDFASRFREAEGARGQQRRQTKTGGKKLSHFPRSLA